MLAFLLGPIRVVLAIPAGRVQFIAADRADTTVEVLPASPSKSRDVQAAEQTTVAYADGVLRIYAAEPKNQLVGPSGSLEVTVQLPAGSRVEAKAAASELRGRVVLRTQSGDISVGAAAGVSAALDADTGYGRISNALKNDGTAELDIRATTSHGDITGRSH
ncbi:hypothetical protein V2J94_33650 [Streptomyces sp. DSM 41524]|uniref:Adhesin domain-containing protein n=1 Tax=Streptomyces asiaticus subsp. ignotus TaxID=3098222 RepID=A0ABU7Q5V9_9ACTN|nr:hypothetical protein [Streptomyces sp. DSM 41524]